MDEIEKEFPFGVRVLAVDDDLVCLKVLEGMLLASGYKVTVAQDGMTALRLLRENTDGYDLVITDVKMPDMDGFKLMEIIGLEMDLPVIMLSVESDVSTVMEGIKHGACDYLVKPVRLEELKLIWKHVIKRSMENTNAGEDTTTNRNDNASNPEDANNNNNNNNNNLRPKRKPREPKKDRDDEADSSSDDDPSSSSKKPRVTWTTELHSKFIGAVNRLGLDRAVPKKILDLMQVPNLTRENVASHLQKYRKALKKNSQEVTQQYRAEVNSSRYGANPPSTLNFPLSNRGANVGNSLENYRNIPRPIPFSHPHPSLYGHGHSPMSSTWTPLPSNQHQNQSNLSQQYAANTQVPSHIRAPQFSYPPPPNTFSLQTAGNPNQLAFRPPSGPQTIIRRPNMPSLYIGTPFQTGWHSGTNQNLSSSMNQTGNLSKQQPRADSLFDQNPSQRPGESNAITAGLSEILPIQNQQQQQFTARSSEALVVAHSTPLQDQQQQQFVVARSGRELVTSNSPAVQNPPPPQQRLSAACSGGELGAAMQIDGGSVAPESNEPEQLDSPNPEALLAEASQEDPIYHLNNSRSAEDLRAVVSQFCEANKSNKGNKL